MVGKNKCKKDKRSSRKWWYVLGRTWKRGRENMAHATKKNHINNVAVIAAAFGFAATVPLAVGLPSFATELLGL